MLIELYDYVNPEISIRKQFEKVQSEFLELHTAYLIQRLCKNTSLDVTINDYFEESNDLKQSIHTLDILVIKEINDINISFKTLTESNQKHIKKMLSRYEKNKRALKRV